MNHQKAKQLSELINLFDEVILKFKDQLRSKLKKNGTQISFDQFVLLFKLENNPGLSQLQLSKLLRKDPASTSRMVKLLVDKKLILKKQTGKEKNIYLSPNGFELIKKLGPEYNRLLVDFGNRIHDKELDIIKELVLRMG